MLKLYQCTKAFKKTKALNSFTCELVYGIYGLLGPNGAGKTTLMRCICGLLQIDSGSIEFGNQAIGYLPQQFGAIKQLTVYEMMKYFAVLKKLPKETHDEEIRRCIELVHLTEKINEKTGSLSGGMVRRLGIAQAVMGNPEIIIFDEPTAGLDPEERVRFKNLLKALKDNKTIIISTHIVSDVEAVCDNIIVIKDGEKICQGNGNQIKSLAENKVYLIPEKFEDKIGTECFIKDRVSKDDENYIYVLSPNQLEFGTKINPCIEDGYLCSLKNI